LLTGLIWLSAYPLRDLESGGTISVDSTGFCTTCRGSYCTERYAPHRTHEWLKAHLGVGTKTHAVLSARITDESGADAPLFVPLLQEAKAAGFDPAEAVGDKAYLSRGNLEGAQALGMDPYIPFKTNSTPRAGGCRLWKEKYHQFQLKREEFEEHYHARSNSESVNSSIKRKLGEALLSKDPQARINELLAKLLAYNIGVVVHEIFEHHIDPGIPGMPGSATPGPPAMFALPPPPPEAAVSSPESGESAQP
jgi:transposase